MFHYWAMFRNMLKMVLFTILTWRQQSWCNSSTCIWKFLMYARKTWRNLTIVLVSFMSYYCQKVDKISRKVPTIFKNAWRSKASISKIVVQNPIKHTIFCKKIIPFRCIQVNFSNFRRFLLKSSPKCKKEPFWHFKIIN